MKIKTRLLGSSILITILGIATISTGYGLYIQVTREHSQLEIASKIERDVTELNFSLHDYLSYRIERPLLQYKAKYQSLTERINSLKNIGPEEKKLILEINKIHKNITDLSENLFLTQEKLQNSANSHDVKLLELEKRIVGLLSIKSRAMVSAAHGLKNIIKTKLDRQLFAAILLLSFLLVGLVLFTIFLALWIYKSVVPPLDKLAQGVIAVGGGNLDHKVGSDAKDEIGQFSRAFDDMADSLKKLTVSRDLLTIEISEREKIEDELLESERQFRLLAENIDDVFWIGSPDWNQVYYASPAFEKLWGQRAEDLYKNPRLWIDAVHPDDQAQVIADIPKDSGSITDVVDFKDYRIQSTDGELHWVKARAFPVRDLVGNVVRITGIAQDITRRKCAEEEIRNLAMTDQLTGLANRNQFQQRFEQSIKLANREGGILALMMLDLDLFKFVNDNFGHPVGDASLKAVAIIFSKFSRETDVIARIGGDEFAILVVHPESEDSAGISAQRIIDELRKPITVMEKNIEIGVSIGIALYPKDAEDQEGLFYKADQALYHAKENKRGVVVQYQPTMSTKR